MKDSNQADYWDKVFPPNAWSSSLNAMRNQFELSRPFIISGSDSEPRIAHYDGKSYHVDEHDEPLYETRFEFVAFFKEGVARVKLDGREFHIDMQGRPLYSERYDEVQSFENGQAWVWPGENNKFACINKKGERV